MRWSRWQPGWINLRDKEQSMPEKVTIERARRDAAQGKSPSTQAGEFVREEIEHVREGKHGAASPQQAIAIGLSKARRAGIKLPPPKRARSSEKVRSQASRDLAKGRSGGSRPSRKRSRGSLRGLKRQGSQSASRSALSKFARSAAQRRGAAARHRAGAAAVRTKGRKGLRAAARKAARTRRRHGA
jgi:hypothetical protein